MKTTYCKLIQENLPLRCSCNDCGETFDDPIEISSFEHRPIGHESYYLRICPYCGSPDIEEDY